MDNNVNTLEHNLPPFLYPQICDCNYKTDVATAFVKQLNCIQMDIEEKLNSIERLLLGQKNVLTFDEGCEFTGLSKTYMYKLTHRNKIPFFKPHGKNIYFSREELEKWLMQNPVKTAEQKDKETTDYVVARHRRR